MTIFVRSKELFQNDGGVQYAELWCKFHIFGRIVWNEMINLVV